MKYKQITFSSTPIEERVLYFFFFSMINKMNASLSWGLGCGLCVSSVCACFTKSLTTSIILTLVILTALAILDKDDDFFHPSMRPPRAKRISSLKTDLEATSKRKSTPNPYRKTNENSSAQSETSAPQNKEQTQTFSLLPPVIPVDWTVKGDQFFKNEHAKREEFSRRHDIYHQSSESRLNLMKSMFEELEESNVKRDPFLDNGGEEECAPKRGREIITRNWAPI